MILSAMLKKVNRKTKLVFVCNPNNPNGTIVSRRAFDEFLSKLPERVIVVLDEAYWDFAKIRDYPNGLDYDQGRETGHRSPDLFKGLRTGRAEDRLCHWEGKISVDCLYQVRDPFPVHRLAQVAAVAALNDEDHADQVDSIGLRRKKVSLQGTG